MTLDSLLTTALSGGIAASIARFFITKSLKDLEHVIEKISEIRVELASITVKLRDHERERETIQRHDKQIAVLETNLQMKKGKDYGRLNK